jgi:hypothetical protein
MRFEVFTAMTMKSAVFPEGSIHLILMYVNFGFIKIGFVIFQARRGLKPVTEERY